jgi:hypothetical protein
MKRAALVVAAVVIAAALAIATTRPSAPSRSTRSAMPSPTARAEQPGPGISRADVQAQRDQVTAAERGRIDRDRLLEQTLVTAAAAHGVSITAGDARPTDDAPQDMVVAPDPNLTVREIAAGIATDVSGQLRGPLCLAA